MTTLAELELIELTTKLAKALPARLWGELTADQAELLQRTTGVEDPLGRGSDPETSQLAHDLRDIYHGVISEGIRRVRDIRVERIIEAADKLNALSAELTRLKRAHEQDQ